MDCASSPGRRPRLRDLRLTELGKIRGSRVTDMPAPLTAPAVALLLAVVTDASPLRVAAAVVIAVCLAVVSLRRGE